MVESQRAELAEAVEAHTEASEATPPSLLEFAAATRSKLEALPPTKIVEIAVAAHIDTSTNEGVTKPTEYLIELIIAKKRQALLKMRSEAAAAAPHRILPPTQWVAPRRWPFALPPPLPPPLPPLPPPPPPLLPPPLLSRPSPEYSSSVAHCSQRRILQPRLSTLPSPEYSSSVAH